MRHSLFLYLMVCLVACTDGRDSRQALLPAQAYQLAWTRLSTHDRNGLRQELELQDSQDVITAWFDTGQEAFQLQLLPGASIQAGHVPEAFDVLYGTRIYRILDHTKYAAQWDGVLLLADSRQAIDLALTAAESGEAFKWLLEPQLGDGVFSEPLPPGLKQQGRQFYQQRGREQLWSRGTGRAKAPPLTDILPYLPIDVARMQSGLLASGRTYYSFDLAGRRLLLAQQADLVKPDQAAAERQYLGFSYDRYADHLRLPLDDGWMIWAASEQDLFAYVDRLMSGSNLAQSDMVARWINEQPEVLLLRQARSMDLAGLPAAADQAIYWYAGRQVGALIRWEQLDAVAPTQMIRQEKAFDGRISSLLHDSTHQRLAVQQENGLVHGYNTSEAAWRRVEHIRGGLLSVPIRLSRGYGYATQDGWTTTTGGLVDYPLGQQPIYYDWPAYDEVVVLLAATDGGLLAVRPDGQLWHAPDGSSPSFEGEPGLPGDGRPTHTLFSEARDSLIREMLPPAEVLRLSSGRLHHLLTGSDYSRILSVGDRALVWRNMQGRVIQRVTVQSPIRQLAAFDSLVLVDLGNRQLHKYATRNGASLGVLHLPQVAAQHLMARLDDRHLLLAETERIRCLDVQTSLIRFLLEPALQPDYLLADENGRWLIWDAGQKRVQLYRQADRIDGPIRSDVPPLLAFGKLWTVEGNLLVSYELNG